MNRLKFNLPTPEYIKIAFIIILFNFLVASGEIAWTRYQINEHLKRLPVWPTNMTDDNMLKILDYYESHSEDIVFLQEMLNSHNFPPLKGKLAFSYLYLWNPMFNDFFNDQTNSEFGVGEAVISPKAYYTSPAEEKNLNEYNKSINQGIGIPWELLGEPVSTTIPADFDWNSLNDFLDHQDNPPDFLFGETQGTVQILDKYLWVSPVGKNYKVYRTMLSQVKQNDEFYRSIFINFRINSDGQIESFTISSGGAMISRSLNPIQVDQNSPYFDLFKSLVHPITSSRTGEQ